MATKRKQRKLNKNASPTGKAKKTATPWKSRKKLVSRKSAGKKAAGPRIRGKAGLAELVGYQPKGLGAVAGGQSGDIQGISGAVRADSESVEELLEEGQTFEAAVIAGVENALDPDESEVLTHEFPENDVPEEYREGE